MAEAKTKEIPARKGVMRVGTQTPPQTPQQGPTEEAHGRRGTLLAAALGSTAGLCAGVVGATSTAVGTTWLVITVAHCYSKHKETLHRLWESF